MQPESTASLTPGIYAIAERRYLVRDGAVRMVRADGTPSRYVVARLSDGELQVTGNGRGQVAALLGLAAGHAEQVTVICREPGCGRQLTDPESIAAGYGPEHREGVA